MKFYNLTFLSKNKKSLNNFIWFIDNNLFLKFNIFKKYSNKKLKIEKFTILKSPHVNKTAQDQFESRFFVQKLTVYSSENLKYLVFLKCFISRLFPDILFKIQPFIGNKIENDIKLNLFNPINFKINHNYKKSQKNKLKNKQIYCCTNIKKVKHFIKIFNIYGELYCFYPC